MRRLLALAPLLCSIAVGCSDAPVDDTSASDSVDALSSSSAPAHAFVSPLVRGGTHHWQVVVMQNEPGYDGVLVFGHPTATADADRMIALDRRTGAVSYISAAQNEDESVIADELHGAAAAIEAYSTSASSIGTQDFVTEKNACFLKVASITLLAVGAVVAAPFVIEGAIAGYADAAAVVAEKGFQGFVVQSARAAWASQKFRQLLAFHFAKDAVKGWLLFSEKGKQLTAPVRRQIHEVVHAKCTPPSTDAITAAGP